MLGLLDADILPYEFGAAKDEKGDDLSLGLTLARMYERIEKIQDRSGVEKMDFFLTGVGNFREKIATIKPYKGNRPKEKSKHWAALRHELKMNFNAEVVDGIEADDIVSIIQYADVAKHTEVFGPLVTEDGTHVEGGSFIIEQDLETAILSRDKDLNMTPGWHYGWEAGNCKEKPLWCQNKLDGLRLFYKQLVTGDSVDNILGLFGVGAKSTLVFGLDAYDNERDMFLHVLKRYQDRFGTYAEQFLLENGRLLWMLRTREDVWQLPTDLQR